MQALQFAQHPQRGEVLHLLRTQAQLDDLAQVDVVQHADGAVAVEGEQVAAVGGEGDIDPGAGLPPAPPDGKSGHVPDRQPHVFLAVDRSQGSAVRGKADADKGPDGRRQLAHLARLGAGQVPEQQLLVPPAGQQRPVRGECQAADAHVLQGRLQDRRASAEVPDLHLPLLVAAGQRVPVGTEGHRPIKALDVQSLLRQRRIGSHAPEGHALPVPQGQPLSLGAEDRQVGGQGDHCLAARRGAAMSHKETE